MHSDSYTLKFVLYIHVTVFVHGTLKCTFCAENGSFSTSYSQAYILCCIRYIALSSARFVLKSANFVHHNGSIILLLCITKRTLESAMYKNCGCTEMYARKYDVQKVLYTAQNVC